jgi:hypothetical protein
MKNPYGDFIRTEYMLIQRRQNFLILKNILIINEDVFVILLLWLSMLHFLLMPICKYL